MITPACRFFYKQEEHLGEYPGAHHIVAVNSHLATFFYKQEEHLGEYPGAPHIVAVNSHLATFFTRRRSTWENVQGHTQVGEAWRRAAHLSHPAENLYCCNARSGFVPGGRC